MRTSAAMNDRDAQDMADELRQQISAERDLSKGLLEYAGKWVAVSNHSVVAHAPTLEELMELVRGTEQQDTVEVFEVSNEPESVCFF
jgi:uncharacterized protein DUF5678